MKIDDALAAARAHVRIGYPWWLKPLLLRDVVAITLGRRIYVSSRVPAAAMERLLRHELAHVRQIERLGLLRFYWRYAAEFLRHFLRVWSVRRAYRMISFEIEAAAAEEVL